MNFLGMGPMELLLILIIAVIVFGPERLPELAAGLGKAIRDFRRATAEYSAEFEQLRAELAAMRQELEEAQQTARVAVEGTAREVQEAVETAANAPVASSASRGEASAEGEASEAEPRPAAAEGAERATLAAESGMPVAGEQAPAEAVASEGVVVASEWPFERGQEEDEKPTQPLSPSGEATDPERAVGSDESTSHGDLDRLSPASAVVEEPPAVATAPEGDLAVGSEVERQNASTIAPAEEPERDGAAEPSPQPVLVAAGEGGEAGAEAPRPRRRARRKRQDDADPSATDASSDAGSQG
ncbi:MAG TPA: twin-arginine translocase TatA/TatE family subunit [Chloroflexota bacterium]